MENLESLPGSGIIYSLTVAAAEDMAELLTSAGHRVSSYTGRTDAGEREELERALLDGGFPGAERVGREERGVERRAGDWEGVRVVVLVRLKRRWRW